VLSKTSHKQGTLLLLGRIYPEERKRKCLKNAQIQTLHCPANTPIRSSSERKNSKERSTTERIYPVHRRHVEEEYRPKPEWARPLHHLHPTGNSTKTKSERDLYKKKGVGGSGYSTGRGRSIILEVKGNSVCGSGGR